MATRFESVSRSLSDLLGCEYLKGVAAGRAFLSGQSDPEAGISLAEEKVEFYPAAMQTRLSALLDRVGTRVIECLPGEGVLGAGAAAFGRAMRAEAAPLNALGYYRIGEDGRLYLTTKSEHYHLSVGHGFPGYSLVEKARSLGIPNATHNNTRGTITRVLEKELIRTANGLGPNDRSGLEDVVSRREDPCVLNRVLNLETGSLAVEAALKMILARFYRIEPDVPRPRYHGRTPVVLVMGNDEGGLQANYHGTTILTQMMRGMWPGLHADLEEAAVWKVVPIRPNCREDLDRAFEKYETGWSKIGGFFHEIIMMNYGGRLLTPEFLNHAYELCAQHDVPTVADEIQSCMWSPQLYLFREYGLCPSCVAIGKGFPGGEYPASRLLFSATLDVMPQFGALVTNGQEELASLSYLVTMEWARANAHVVAELGSCYHRRLRELAAAHPRIIEDVDGWNHMSMLRFLDLDKARAFVDSLVQRGLDVSVQSYKENCPPVVLTKLPLIADEAMIDFVVERMEEAIQTLA